MNHSEPPSSPESKPDPISKSKTPGKDSSGKQPSSSLKSRILRSSLLVFGCASICAIGLFSRVYSTNSAFRGIFNTWFKAASGDIRKVGDPSKIWPVEKYFPGKQNSGLTLLFLGCDHDYKDVNSKPNQILKSYGRSDSMMLVRFDFQDKTINVLSLARDTKVNIPGKGYHKLNAAHEYGGPELSVATVREDFGVSPDYYLDINFESFQQSVDTLGGVDVMIHKPLDYDDNWGNLHVHLKPGYQHLNGYQAMGYVRIRHSDNDLERQKRQHEFLEALRGKIASPSGIFSLPGLLEVISNNTKSDLSNDQLLTLATFSRNIPKENVHLETLPVTEGSTFVYVIPHKAEALIRKMFYKKDDKIAINVNAPESRSSRRESGSRRRRRSVTQDETDTDVRVLDGDKRSAHKAETPKTDSSDAPNQDPNASQPPENEPSSPSSNSSDAPKTEKRDKSDSSAKDSGDGAKSDAKDPSKPKDSGSAGGSERGSGIKI